MIVDDDASIRTTLADVLRSEGYEVGESENGANALTTMLLGPSRPSLVLLDLMMPVMRGEALLQSMRALRMLDDIAVVVLTASLKPVGEGAQGILRKPFMLDELFDVVAENFPRRTMSMPPLA